MSTTSPTARCMDLLRKRGWPYQRVEHWQDRGGAAEAAKRETLEVCANLARQMARDRADAREAGGGLPAILVAQAIDQLIPPPRLGPPGVRIDLFGCIDILALDGQPGCLGIQATSGSGHPAKHLAKMRTLPDVRPWLEAGNRLQIWAWRKAGAAGDALVSADSMAWSARARREAPLPGHPHKNCANCLEFALLWRGALPDEWLQARRAAA
jgi:hypothetical protein